MTDIRLPLNVFSQSAVAGQVAEISAAGPVSQTVMVLSSSENTIYPAYPVKLVPGSSQVPLVDLATPGTDDMYGIALFNPKVSSFVAKDVLQATTRGSVIFLTSGGTLSRGDKVGMHATTFKLIPATNANYIGRLLDDAVLDQVVRVEIDLPIGVASTSGD